MLMACGWLLAAAAGLLAVRSNPDRRLMTFRNADSNRMEWRVAVPYFVGLFLAVFGGAGLQRHSLGLWAVPIAIIPLVVAYRIPVWSHNARFRRCVAG